jgi:hypothetical protein
MKSLHAQILLLPAALATQILTTQTSTSLPSDYPAYPLPEYNTTSIFLASSQPTCSCGTTTVTVTMPSPSAVSSAYSIPLLTNSTSLYNFPSPTTFALISSDAPTLGTQSLGVMTSSTEAVSMDTPATTTQQQESPTPTSSGEPLFTGGAAMEGARWEGWKSGWTRSVVVGVLVMGL